MQNPKPAETGGKGRKDCIESGKRLDKDLHDKLAAIEANPQSLGEEARKPFDQIPGYRLSKHDSFKVTDPKYRAKDKTVQKMFKDLNLDQSTNLICAQVHTLGSDNGLENLVSQNSFSQGASDGVVIAEISDMKKSNVTSPQHRIEHWSDLFFQVIKNIYFPDDVPRITYILRDMIGNTTTRECIKEAHIRHQDNISDGKATFDRCNATSSELETYYSLLGSPNGVGVAHLLKDYPATFRQRKIVKIHTWMAKIYPEDQHSSFWKYAMAFELGPASFQDPSCGPDHGRSKEELGVNVN
ncbi:hypothetical protein HYFRA_00013475 [Hymenoscyphus fraxineus]|uniref:Uncharacterized protein n=1 Tax=Hymenoscyphus fraxineus TaxID=746836 RepID=A0A9N9L903_9HELO|nr:hypothetical protein HYFRA_00013475 [Hymenoscyphus fraxineus]